MIADILFDLPLRRPLSYAVPPDLKLAPGQRVSAPLQGRPRIGVVAALHAGDPEGLAVIQGAVEPAPVFSTAMLDLGLWAAAESLSAPGSTLAALSPPPPRRGTAEAAAPPPEPAPAPAEAPVLWTDADRDARLAEEAARAPGPVLVVAPDIESAARWAERLGGARLGVWPAEPARRAAWLGAMRGRPRVVVGTRSALLLPLPAPATLALLDEHDAAHKPPGAPRLHSRELLMERARREGSRLLLLAGAPAVETWHRADQLMIQRAGAESSDAWPQLIAADTRGILRNHPLTLPLTRALEDAARRGTRVALVLSREAAALGCDECGEVIRCPDCGVALGLSRVTASLACRLCGQTGPLAGACPRCGGHRLSPFGWSPERVMTALRKRFPRLTAARAGGRADKAGGRSGSAQVLVGGPGLLRGLLPGSLSAVGFVALDGLLRVPDFRAGERAFQALWAAAEAVGPTGRVIVQTLHPEYYAIEAARTRRRAAFYEPELRFRAELGYPPFRRLCLIDVRGRSLGDARALLDECAATLRGIAGLTVYAPTPRGTGLGRRPWWRLLVKGPDALPGLLDEPLRPLLERRRRPAGMIEIEMDPVSL
jgi:primosomal protein N' (replication factor Y) (superfamily II helicase)